MFENRQILSLSIDKNTQPALVSLSKIYIFQNRQIYIQRERERERERCVCIDNERRRHHHHHHHYNSNNTCEDKNTVTLKSGIQEMLCQNTVEAGRVSLWKHGNVWNMAEKRQPIWWPQPLSSKVVNHVVQQTAGPRQKHIYSTVTRSPWAAMYSAVCVCHPRRSWQPAIFSIFLAFHKTNQIPVSSKWPHRQEYLSRVR